MNVAGKTGTTSDDCDRWFMGYTPHYIGGVWFGYAMPMSLNGFSETRAPSLAIWDDVMAKLHQPLIDSGSVESFELADGIVRASVCAKSGKLATKNCDDGIRSGYFVSGNMPGSYCTEHTAQEDSSSGSSSNSVTTEPSDTKETTTGDTLPERPDNSVEDTTTEPDTSTEPTTNDPEQE